MTHFNRSSAEFYASRDSRTRAALPGMDFSQSSIHFVLSDGLEKLARGQAMLLLAVNLASRIFRNIVVTSKNASVFSHLQLFRTGSLYDELKAVACGADPFINSHGPLKIAIMWNKINIISLLLELGSALDPEFEYVVRSDIISVIEKFGIINHKLTIK